MESRPPITWTESGQTPALPESSSSRLRGARIRSRDPDRQCGYGSRPSCVVDPCSGPSSRGADCQFLGRAMAGEEGDNGATELLWLLGEPEVPGVRQKDVVGVRNAGGDGARRH